MKKISECRRPGKKGIGNREEGIGVTERRPALPGHALSPRQRQITALMLEGLQDKEIAGRLQIAPQTVKNHNQEIFKKLGLENRIYVILHYTGARSAAVEGQGIGSRE
jgi:DNA-binding NarL/FixJ family response regulator